MTMARDPELAASSLPPLRWRRGACWQIPARALAPAKLNGKEEPKVCSRLKFEVWQLSLVAELSFKNK